MRKMELRLRVMWVTWTASVVLFFTLALNGDFLDGWQFFLPNLISDPGLYLLLGNTAVGSLGGMWFLNHPE